MILYLDTSSLIKLYLEEEHSDLVRTWAAGAEVLCTSRITFPEAVAALARRWRQRDLDRPAFDAVHQSLEDDWPGFIAVELNEEAAAEVAVRLALRGFDAIQLAAAIEIVAASGQAPAFFSSFDRQLNRAARAEGLAVLDAESDIYPLAAVQGTSSEIHEPGASR